MSEYVSNEVSSPSNRLAREKSPYLLQHAHNPVDWYPWGAEAFEKARIADKPILLSIGYSTCHWCHVMEHESFEDRTTADLMNANFVSIKVDREERPDIDAIYMSYVTATTGSGGWPMTVFLTPDRKPFYGGTYFPPQDRYGMPGFKTLLSSIADAWKTRRDEIVRSADSAVRYLNEDLRAAGEKATLGPGPLDGGFGYFDSAFDAEDGGFGGAPKFPRSHALSFLLRYAKRTKSARALEMATVTLDAMARGGIYDQLGGGFHRYSTDKKWRVPHFEKMLYDQALLVTTYLEAYQVTKNHEYARIARETMDYVLREMTDAGGGFHSAEDADSLDERGQKREGAFFLWKKEEVENLLGPAAAEFTARYGIEAAGNAISDPHHEFEGKNVLYAARPGEDTPSLAASRQRLLEVRAARPRPHRDDKVLTDWNGLMIAALARGGRVLGEPRYVRAASRAAEFVVKKLRTPGGKLLHRYRDGEAAIEGSLNDYAFFIDALIELYQADFDETRLVLAEELAERMTDLFADEAAGGFYLTARDAEALITRPKEVYDGAIPSGGAVAATALFKLSRLTGDMRWDAAARKTLESMGGALEGSPANFTQALCALDFALGPVSEVVIAGKDGDPAVERFLKAFNAKFGPGRVAMRSREGEGRYPWRDKGPVGGKAAAYVCRDFACGAPETDPDKFEKSLD